MATVYLGRAVAEGGFARLVAIKVMHPHIAEKPEFEAMFLDEARLAASIRHPNVVSTIDVQKSPEAMFLVMDYVDGPALNRILRKLEETQRPLPIDIALRILIDTLNGLEAAHQLTDHDGGHLNLVHRDVSPQNILVGADGIARITDFGVARAEARLGFTVGGEIKGKLGYMPPEQSKGEEIDCRADVYAAGVVLWECLTLQRLFAADNPGTLIYKLLLGATQSPRDIRPEVPYNIDRVCMHALALDPAERYQSAADFAEALEDAAQEDGIRVASARGLAAYMEQIKPLVGAGDDENEGSGDFSSIPPFPSSPSSPAVDSVMSGLGSGTGKPHAIGVRMVPPSQGRMVTALAAVIALTIGVGAAGIVMISEPVTADRLEPWITDIAVRHAAAARLPPTARLPAAQLPAPQRPAAADPPATDSAEPEPPEPPPVEPPSPPLPTPRVVPKRPDKPDPKPSPKPGGFRPGGL